MREGFKESGSWRTWIWALPVLLALIVAGLIWKRDRPPPKSPTFSFRANDAGGDLKIEWDKDSEPIRGAVRGKLEIADGGSPLLVALDMDRLRRGSFVYPRKSDELDLKMTVYPAQGSPVQEVAKVVAPYVAPPQAERAKVDEAAQLRNERDSLQTEVEQLRKSLRTETARNRQLEDAMRILKNRMQVEKLRAPSVK